MFEAIEARLLLSADLTPVAELGMLHNTRADPDAPAVIESPASLLNAGNSQALGRQIVFVDSGVREYETLLTNLPDVTRGNTRVVVLDDSKNGVEQITETLKSEENVSALHILSHGASGSVSLGSAQLNADTVTAHAVQLASWNEALRSDADILLYGCNVADGEWGVQFVNELSVHAGADVAASNDATGARQRGGDWDLEYSTGAVDVASIIQAVDFAGLLGPVTPSLVGDAVTFTGTDTGPNAVDALYLRVTTSNELEFSEDNSNWSVDLDLSAANNQTLVISDLTVITVDLLGADDQLHIDASLDTALNAVADTASLSYNAGDGLGDTLFGPDADITWTVNGPNAGSLGTKISFDSVENLTGGTQVDTFNLDADVTGTVDGGGNPAGSPGDTIRVTRDADFTLSDDELEIDDGQTITQI
ncbi:MAG: DUF4347 domain-containing protein, partial [Betaproteobacteria bacterium]